VPAVVLPESTSSRVVLEEPEGPMRAVRDEDGSTPETD